MREVIAFDRDHVKRITCLGQILADPDHEISPDDHVKMRIIDDLAIEIAARLVKHEKVLIVRRHDGVVDVWRYAAEVTVIVPGGDPPVRLTLPTPGPPLVMEKTHGRETS